MGDRLTIREKLIDEHFINVPMSIETMPFYTVRRMILERMKEAVKGFHGTVLDIGCGFKPYQALILQNEKVEKYIGLDLANAGMYAESEPDLTWNGREIPLGDGSVDCVVATEFLEHHSEPDAVLAELIRVLKPNGILFATVPFLWNLHEIPHDEYRYTPYSLERHLRKAGFRNIEIKAMGGWNLSMAQMLGLWLSFSRMGKIRRRIMKTIFFPFYAWLIKTDTPPGEFDGLENSMFCGLSVTAIK
jgi:SAM-dependent methyltransferase